MKPGGWLGSPEYRFGGAQVACAIGAMGDACEEGCHKIFRVEDEEICPVHGTAHTGYYVLDVRPKAAAGGAQAHIRGTTASA